MFSALKDKTKKQEKTIVLAGNPNVGKSTIFNALTGLKQHTGNWCGKTVDTAKGCFYTPDCKYNLVDTPGTYSLLSDSAEEKITRDYISFFENDGVIVVCDATCLERGLNLVLQSMEISQKVVLVVNLMDEAFRKGIKIDCEKLSSILKIPVVSACARSKKGIKNIISALENGQKRDYFYPEYSKDIKEALNLLAPYIEQKSGEKINSFWLAHNLLKKEYDAAERAKNLINYDFLQDKEFAGNLEKAQYSLYLKGISPDDIHIQQVDFYNKISKEIFEETVEKNSENKDFKWDKIFTGKFTAYPVMAVFLLMVLYITIKGANYPSAFLSDIFAKLGIMLRDFLESLNTPAVITDIIVDGIYRIMSWVVAVMLPPMAIFFPVFTILEDVGYLPRIAYCIDRPFAKCSACGKQALTMCMGFGCNAVGVTGTRIISSKREKLLAVLTNNFIPCNGRFPTLIAVITMFFAAGFKGAFILFMVICLGICATFACTKLLSLTLLKGYPSFFITELPPYRKPQICKTVVRSVFDRTVFVLARAIAVSAPAGAVIWILANTYAGGESVIKIISDFLNPIGEFMGMDGVILTAFILGIPANEIVIPIIIMIYSGLSSVEEIENITLLKQLFVQNGWDGFTALSVVVFSVMHWPCATTLLTIKRETGSVKWTVISALLPTAAGFICCAGINLISKFFA